MLQINSVNNGNCLDLMNDINDKSIDMILCDLPYGTTACKWDTVIPFEPLWEQYNRAIKDNGAIVLFGSEPFSSFLRMSNIKQYKYDLIWQKEQSSNFMLAKKQVGKIHENISIFYNKQCKYNPQMTTGCKPSVSGSKNKIETSGGSEGGKECSTRTGATDRYPVSILKYNRDKNKSGIDSFHPTQKPVALFEYLIKTYTNEGELVLDNCAGSGTTAIACLRTNRNYILIEQETKYCDIANKRIAEFIP